MRALTEQDKFRFLLKIIRQYCKVSVRKREYVARTFTQQIVPGCFLHGKKHPIDGYSYISDQKITLVIMPEMTEGDWSEAAAILLHEFGHCYNYQESERKAWRDAEKWVDKNYAEFKPRRFGEIKKHDLDIYGALELKKKDSWADQVVFSSLFVY